MFDLKRTARPEPLRRHFKLVSVEKLTRTLTAFDQSVEIKIERRRKRSKAAGWITFVRAK